MPRRLSKLRQVAPFWRFGRCRSGGVAMMFGFMIVVLCGMAGLAIDFGRYNLVRSKLQHAVDSAALSANPTGTADNAQMSKAIKGYFESNVGQAHGAKLVKVDWKAIDGGQRVAATADVEMTFVKVFGIKSMPVAVVAEAELGQGTSEVALVLDNTNSMAGAKMAALKTAAKDMVEQLFAGSKPDALKMGVVPFSQYVNVGLKNRTAPWMSVPVDSTKVVNQCYWDQKWKNCVPKTGTCFDDGTPYSCTWQECEPDGPAVEKCGDVTINEQWNGCVGSRTNPDLKVRADFSDPLPGIMNVWCPQEFARLAGDKTAVLAKLDALSTQGDTYIPSGLMWGWRVLSPEAPLADGGKSVGKSKVRKHLVLMTDGSNTRSQAGQNHEGYSATDANTNLAELCKEVKKDKITIYTVAFEVADPQIKSLLTECASSPSKFFDAANPAQLASSFSAIAGSLQKVTLTK